MTNYARELTPNGDANIWLSKYPDSGYNYAKLLSNDGDSTYVYITGYGANADAYTLSGSTPHVGTITSVEVVGLCRKTGGTQAYVRFGFVVPGPPTDWASYQELVTTSYIEYSHNFSLSPDGDAWTWSDIDNLQVAMILQATSVGFQSRCTRLRVFVNYSTPESFIFSMSNTGSITVNRGQASSNTINCTYVSGTANDVMLSVGGLPSGASATFVPTHGTPTFSSALSISTTESTPLGSFWISVFGTPVSGTIQSTTFELIVTEAAPPAPPPPGPPSPTNYAPVISLTSGSTDLTTWYDSISGSITVTTSVPELNVHMMQSAPTDLVTIGSPILLTVNGVNLFRGFVDDYTNSTDKKKGYAKEIKCRGYAARWLDTYTSIHRASDSAQAIANRILLEYNNRRGLADPAINWRTNDAPSNLSYPIFQRRESIQDMFMGLAQLLAAPPGYLGGSDYMYDFYVDADGYASFVKVAGTWATDSLSNHLQLKDDHRTVSKVEVRGTPVKNDIWLWGGQTSGRLPLDMQANFQNWVQPYDAWTENSASLFGGYPSGQTVISVSGVGQVGIGKNPAFGNYAIKATITGVGASNLCYVYLRFPISGRTLGQEPGGGFNTFNEAPQYLERKWDGTTWPNATGMSEQMGEIQGIGFYLFSTQNFTWYLEVVDGSNRLVQSEPTKYDVGGFFSSGYWYFNENQAFGPSAQWKVSGNPGYAVEDFDWSNVAELRWHFNDYPTANHVVWIDGLRFIKPLVVHYPDYNMSGAANPYNDPWNNGPYPYAYRSATALSTEMRTEQSVDDWKVGKRIAASLYETMAYPQAYWTLEGFGVTECIPGQKFLYDTNELCMRENRFKITKDEGFSSTITAVAQYRSGRWSNECLADFGRIMKEVYQPITNVTKSVSGS